MATRNLLMRITADVSQAVGEMKKLKGEEGVEGVTGSLSGLSALAPMALTAITGLALAVRQGAEDWLEYTLEVGNLRDTLQITTEDASALQAVMERFEISSGTMTTAFTTMAKQGVEPTLAGLQGLLTQYDSITGATEKMEFAQKNLGTQAISEIIPMWNRLTEVQKANFSNLEDGLDITEENIKAARDLEEAQKDWATVLEKVGGSATMYWHDMAELADKFRTLIGLTPILTEETKLLYNAEELHIAFLKEEHKITEELAPALTKQDIVLGWLTKGYTAGSLAAWALVDAQEALLNQAKAMTKGLDWMFSQGMGATDADFASTKGQLAPGLPGGGGDWLTDALGRQYRRTPGGGYELGPNYNNYATGGSFSVGGSGGTDSQPVSFMATPGETVSIGGGTSDMLEIKAEIRRMVDSLPAAIADAVERR